MENWQLIDEAKDLIKECRSLTEFEAMKVLLLKQQNEIIKKSFWTRTSNSNIFEDIAENINDLKDELSDIHSALERIAFNQ
jgi:recombinational DNA repair protein (RecF pathway)